MVCVDAGFQQAWAGYGTEFSQLYDPRAGFALGYGTGLPEHSARLLSAILY